MSSSARNISVTPKNWDCDLQTGVNPWTQKELINRRWDTICPGKRDEWMASQSSISPSIMNAGCTFFLVAAEIPPRENLPCEVKDNICFLWNQGNFSQWANRCPAVQVCWGPSPGYQRHLQRSLGLEETRGPSLRKQPLATAGLKSSGSLAWGQRKWGQGKTRKESRKKEEVGIMQAWQREDKIRIHASGKGASGGLERRKKKMEFSKTTKFKPPFNINAH